MNMGEYIERKFRRMKPSEQRFIQAAREDRVFWRGEDIETLKIVYEETQKARAMGMRKYRSEAVGKLKALIKGMA